jgi:protein-tyrosine-phosphatase
MNIGRPFNVLFVCNGNSARSIIAEAILNKVGAGHFRAYSAGSQPKGAVDQHAIDLLKRLGYETEGLHSKSWHDLTGPSAPEFDLIFTLCDEAAGETCPVFPGTPITAHWGVPDPVKASGNHAEVALAFDDTHHTLYQMIELLIALPIRSIDKMSLHAKLREIGERPRAAAAG